MVMLHREVAPFTESAPHGKLIGRSEIFLVVPSQGFSWNGSGQTCETRSVEFFGGWVSLKVSKNELSKLMMKIDEGAVIKF